MRRGLGVRESQGRTVKERWQLVPMGHQLVGKVTQMSSGSREAGPAAEWQWMMGFKEEIMTHCGFHLSSWLEKLRWGSLFTAMALPNLALRECVT